MIEEHGVKPSALTAQAEEGEIEQTAELMVALLDKRYKAKNKKILRGVHPKSHGCVKATFQINADLCSTYKVGLFARPGNKYEAVVRFSNAAALISPDVEGKVSASRGMAIKIFNVEGESGFLPEHHGNKDQDFLMINTPSFAFANISDYLELNKILLKNNDNPSEFFARLKEPGCPHSIKAAFNIVNDIQKKHVANPLEVEYFGAAPFLFGPDRVMRFKVRPRGTLKEQNIPDPAADNYLKDALAMGMSGNEPIVFDFMVQVRSSSEGAENLGLEDATIFWDEANFPYVSVATMTISAPQLDIYSQKNEDYCESLVFTPWHSLAEHKPLGGINRLRQHVYEVSAEYRKLLPN